MASQLPPEPRFRLWKGEKLQVANIYSAAGISTSFILDSPGGRFFLEAGDGCLRDLIEIERKLHENDEIAMKDIRNKVEDLHGVIISHAHYDHYSGLLNILNFLHLLGRTSPLKIIIPRGAEPVKMIRQHFLETLWEPCPFIIEVVEFDGEEELEVGGHSIRSLPVVHRYSRPGSVGGRIPSMAYSIEYEGERVVYSGDTGGVPGLAGFMSGADLALVEATFVDVPEGHEEVHLDLRTSEELGSAAKSYWQVHFTSTSWKEHSSR